MEAQPWPRRFPGTVTKVVRQLFPATASPALVEWITAEELRADPATSIAILEESSAYDEAGALAKVEETLAKAITGEHFGEH